MSITFGQWLDLMWQSSMYVWNVDYIGYVEAAFTLLGMILLIVLNHFDARRGFSQAIYTLIMATAWYLTQIYVLGDEILSVHAFVMSVLTLQLTICVAFANLLAALLIVLAPKPIYKIRSFIAGKLHKLANRIESTAEDHVTSAEIKKKEALSFSAEIINNRFSAANVKETTAPRRGRKKKQT